MAPVPITPRPSAPTTQSSRTRPIRPKSAKASQSEKPPLKPTGSEPPRKKLRYIPGGPGGGGRYVDEQGTEIPVGGTGPGGYNYIGPRGRVGRENFANGVVPVVYPSRRDRSARTRTVMPRSQQPPMRFQSAAQAAAVVQSDGYKPREERAWEEFHPEMDIENSMKAFTWDEVEGIVSRPSTPVEQSSGHSLDTDDSPNLKTQGEDNATTGGSATDSSLTISIPGTPGGGRRRPGRPPKDPVAFFTKKAAQLGKSLNVPTPKAQKPTTPIQNTTAKERLTLPQPSYRKTDTLARFEDKALGLVRYVDKSMANVGYQASDIFVRPERTLIKLFDANLEEDLDIGPGNKSDGETIVTIGSGGVGRVEYDMDEQDDKWLHAYNAERKAGGFEGITREIFEITITKIEKEWHALEKRIPKPNPKPPQTHRPRSSSAAAVNGEPQAGEEQDSKCAICDDGDCENTNAIVFCDGCDLAVHQECYGVPFIPEGQWLCRKCQLIGRGIPTCIFCPNTDGAFKQTNASKWAHLICAMWIPEVSLGNHTFMEPVMEVEKVPKTRWKLTCYLCNQRMGACIQCGNKACYQAFHVTCARRARLFLKMKNNHGTLAVLDGTTVLKAFCDKHCPTDYSKENDVPRAAREARIFYKRTMRGRLWADSQASALALAATHRNAVTEHQADESQLTGARVALTLSESKKKGNSPPKAIWKLPSGAPVIPQVVYNSVESSLARFAVRKRKEYAADACRYWTLKREARRGAALLKRLQLQMETFSSMEITRRNFAGMGHAGRPRLARRIEFATTLLRDLEILRNITEEVKDREYQKLEKHIIEEELINGTYFPVAKLLPDVVEKAAKFDIKGIFTSGLGTLREKLDNRFYTNALSFVSDLGTVFSNGISNEPQANLGTFEADTSSPSKKQVLDIKERRKLAKRTLRAVQPMIELAVEAECALAGRSADRTLKEVEALLESCLEIHPDAVQQESLQPGEDDADGDVDMIDANLVDASPIKLSNGERTSRDENGAEIAEPDDLEMTNEADDEALDSVVVDSGSHYEANGDTVTVVALAEVNGNKSPLKNGHINGNKNNTTPSDTDGYVSALENGQAGPPTPPISTVDSGNERGDKVLADGGVPPFLLQAFTINGAYISEANLSSHLTNGSDEAGEVEEIALNGASSVNDMEGDSIGVAPPPAAATTTTTTTSKAKKGKAKKRRR